MYLVRSNPKKMKYKFLTLPTKTTVFTLTKAPMAQKKNSKEQFIRKIYRFKISFWSKSSSEKFQHLPTITQTTYNLMKILQKLPFFESNLLLIESLKLKTPSQDTYFFTYK